MSAPSDVAGRLAEVAVRFAANVQPGQLVAVIAELGHEAAVRAITAEAYRAGARLVDPVYLDPHVRRARLLHADPATLDFVPPWRTAWMRALGDEGAAVINTAGETEPELMADVDPARVGREQWVHAQDVAYMDARCNWTIIPWPTPAWARLVHPGLDTAAAVARLWEQVERVCRLDAPDPARAWRERMARLEAVAGRLSAARFDRVELAGPGTRLSVGLLPSSQWGTAMKRTPAGVAAMVNLPSEEVFAVPDPERVEGHVRSTRPLSVRNVVVRGLRVRFEGGRVVEVDADEGADVIRAQCEIDDGARRLGEVALVDAGGRVGAEGTTFFETLLDENAASHIALGIGFEDLVGEDDVPRVNQSAIHVDFMIGGADVAVDGVTRERDVVPVLRDGHWRL